MDNLKILKAEKIGINFGGLKAVDGLDFEIGDETVGLIGPNGSGKTTFLNIISGIYKPSTGRVIFSGGELSRFTPDEVRKKGISRTFQTNRLCMNLSVIDNLLLGLYCEQKTSWLQAIFNRSLCMKEINEGIGKCFEAISVFNPEIVDRAYELISTIPLIDRRRIEIARAIVGRPKLLLLDEPTAGLNKEETHQMIEDITKIRDGGNRISIIIIEHDMSVISKISNRVVCLNAGQKIAEGTFEEVSQSENVRMAYLGG
jgi:branched-chain amino acid transport system ATP-binding protein